MTTPIDYSRPVGWWCPVCGHHEAETDVDVLWNQPDWLAGTDEHDKLVPIHLCTGSGWCIPRFLPLPTPEPVEVDEVETGEAEVVTLSNPHGSCRLAECSVWITERGWIEDGESWCDGDDPEDVVLCIEAIAAASANARKKREGAK